MPPASTSARAASWFGCHVTICTTPPTASAPYRSLPLPRSTSTRSIATCGTLSQYTHPPNASFNGTPSVSTSERLAPVPPRPRSVTPCAVGFDTREDVRRNRVKPGTILSASSSVSAALVSSSTAGRTVIVTAGSARGRSVREDVTFTASKKGAGCSVTCR